jgi:hypothetical protein
VKRFVGALKARSPEHFDVLEAPPGEETQVDLGLGALTRRPNRKYRRPYLFVMTRKHSGGVQVPSRQSRSGPVCNEHCRLSGDWQASKRMQ